MNYMHMHYSMQYIHGVHMRSAQYFTFTFTFPQTFGSITISQKFEIVRNIFSTTSMPGYSLWDG